MKLNTFEYESMKPLMHRCWVKILTCTWLIWMEPWGLWVLLCRNTCERSMVNHGIRKLKKTLTLQLIRAHCCSSWSRELLETITLWCLRHNDYFLCNTTYEIPTMSPFALSYPTLLMRRIGKHLYVSCKRYQVL